MPKFMVKTEEIVNGEYEVDAASQSEALAYFLTPRTLNMAMDNGYVEQISYHCSIIDWKQIIIDWKQVENRRDDVSTTGSQNPPPEVRTPHVFEAGPRRAEVQRTIPERILSWRVDYIYKGTDLTPNFVATEEKAIEYAKRWVFEQPDR
jgi:hypothetical protein